MHWQEYTEELYKKDLHLHANVVQWAYNEAQGLLEVKSSAILGLVGSNQFSLYL